MFAFAKDKTKFLKNFFLKNNIYVRLKSKKAYLIFDMKFGIFCIKIR